MFFNIMVKKITIHKSIGHSHFKMLLNLKIGPELSELLTFENETFSENKIIAKQ